MLKYFVLSFFIILIVNFNIVNAETIKIPEWVFSIYDFWIEKKISDDEFSTTLTYLETYDIISLILHRDYDVKTNFLLSIMKNQNIEQYASCSYGWYVTGYFVPIEKDYSGKFITISINENTREFRQDFINTVKIEGWGKTLSGDYLGWYDDSFHINKNALDSDGNILTAGKVAIDTAIIDHDSKLVIPTLPQPWNEIAFLSSDEGTSIKGKHIDLFTGEGQLAENETFRITSYNNKVCE
ncbi:MAG: hypothetical protein HQ505_05605 [Nitrosopumilus sp.]|nr:hypothetical protein [Nitrosopumilus sp.]